jgi:hypothetical protein
MFIGNAFRFLKKPLLNANYINNDAFLYIASLTACFYIFTTEKPSNNSQHCDNYYKYWKNNSITIKDVNSI